MNHHDQIPILDLRPGIEAQWEEIMGAITEVVRNAHFIMGPSVVEFEKQAAAYLKSPTAVGVNSGTDALFIGLEAAGIKPGDEVITTPFTFFATAEAIARVGATPVFVDIDARTFNLDPTKLEEKISAKTKGIIVVHLFGQACDMAAILKIARQHDLKVIEDVAQAFGGEFNGDKLGTFGDVGAFSFFPSKNLGAFGDGGMVCSANSEIVAKAKMLRTHGSRKKYYNEMIGYNSRLDEIQAAILKVRLPKLDACNAQRRNAANLYRELLSEIPGIVLPQESSNTKHVYHQFTLRVLQGKRDALQSGLGAKGIGTMVYYPVPLNRMDVFRDSNCVCTQAERAASEVLSLPIWPEIQPEIQIRICDELRQLAATL